MLYWSKPFCLTPRSIQVQKTVCTVGEGRVNLALRSRASSFYIAREQAGTRMPARRPHNGGQTLLSQLS